MTALIVVIVIVALAILLVASSSIRIAREYERGVVFRLGRLIDLRGPGLFLIIPFGFDRLTKVDLRVITLEVPPQEVITSDNVTVKVNAVIFFQVLDARAAITRVFDFRQATSQIAQTTLRAVLGQSSLDELLSSRDVINQKLQTIIDGQTEPWGVKVGAVEVKDAELAPTMVRALGRQAEAEREHRGRVPGGTDAGQRRPGHLDAARGPGAALHADAARHGLQPELDHRLSDPDRAHPPAPGGPGAHGRETHGRNRAGACRSDQRLSASPRLRRMANLASGCLTQRSPQPSPRESARAR